jgi:colanic acid/amylovoran biosynthesis glycosyltransferase
MPTVAFLSNLFPAAVEPYVVEEIEELRRRGVSVIPCSARNAGNEFDDQLMLLRSETLYLQPIRFWQFMRALWVCVIRYADLRDCVARILARGEEPLRRRLSALVHTVLGTYLAVMLRSRSVDHIHVHHGYFSSWIAMVAARLLGIDFSMTLHGSDLLLHPHYLDLKLKNCKFCVTVSEFNRRHILEHYPLIHPNKILVRRMGIDCFQHAPTGKSKGKTPAFAILAVGRLHPVKDHAFLIRACRLLKDRGMDVACLIAGDGPERANLESLVRSLSLTEEVRFLGHVPHEQLPLCYAGSDVVVLTSRSEGIPLVLMEAMACGRPVLAPSITGIPELVIHGKTGFLYRPGSLEDFVARIEEIRTSLPDLARLCDAARQHVFENFNREKNLAALCDLLQTQMIRPKESKPCYEDPILQQI